MQSRSLVRLVESAVLLAVGTVLSLLSFPGFWPLGGSITFCSMLPVVILAHRHGTPWGLLCGLIYALLQMALGFGNVQYAYYSSNNSIAAGIFITGV